MQITAAFSSGRNTRVSRPLILLGSLTFGLILLLFAYTMWITWLNRGLSDDSWLLGIALLAYGFAGWVLTTYRPRNWIGWLLLIMSISAMISGAGSTTTDLPSNPLGVTVSQLTVLIWAGNTWSWFLVVGMFPFLLLLYPSGHLPGRRWRWAAWADAIGLAGMLILTAFGPSPDPNYTNPFAIPQIKRLAFLQPIFLWIFVLLLLVSSSGLFNRYRRGSSVERQQIKWFVFAGLVFIVILILEQLIQLIFPGVSIPNLIYALMYSLFPLAITIAILRYRLWDIDILIRKTLLYGALTALLGLIFLGMVAILQSLFATISNEQSPISIVLTTLAIAALFNPLRRRLQDFIDRRFYRQKYDAEQSLAELASISRAQVDVDLLTRSLTNVIENSFKPTSLTVWLKQDEKIPDR